MAEAKILSKVPPIAAWIGQYGNDDQQFADLRVTLEYPPSALVSMIHGGFWRAKYDLVHAGHLCAALTEARIATVNVEYRRVGNSGGGWPGSLHDIESALQFISASAKEKRLDLDRVV